MHDYSSVPFTVFFIGPSCTFRQLRVSWKNFRGAKRLRTYDLFNPKNIVVCLYDDGVIFFVSFSSAFELVSNVQHSVSQRPFMVRQNPYTCISPWEIFLDPKHV